MASIMAGHGHGELRAYIEAIPPATYLASRYYERWARALEASVVDGGLVSQEDVSDRARAIAAGEVEAPRRGAVAPEIHAAVASTLGTWVARPAEAAARFRAGDRVRVRRMSPDGHTRCPRYVRGVEGVVESVTGGFRRPDPGDHPLEQTYTVRFALRDLWGDDADDGCLCLDIWEGYLE
ncbi:MAG: nitrile hydratase subunit beta [Chloroflexi bacterium]|nr:MAG: nitrile hydratase subunit beta [Chloroflexota bacterium]